MWSCVSDKAKFFPENFTNNSNLDDSCIFLSAFTSRTNLELHDIYVTPTMVKKVIKTLIHQKPQV